MQFGACNLSLRLHAPATAVVAIDEKVVVVNLMPAEALIEKRSAAAPNKTQLRNFTTSSCFCALDGLDLRDVSASVDRA